MVFCQNSDVISLELVIFATITPSIIAINVGVTSIPQSRAKSDHTPFCLASVIVTTSCYPSTFFNCVSAYIHGRQPSCTKSLISVMRFAPQMFEVQIC